MNARSGTRIVFCGIFGLLAAPIDARFVQVNPVGYDDQFNLYTYVRNDPINMFDSTGRRSEAVGNNIRIIPWDTSHPRVTIPVGQTGAQGISG